MQLSFSSRDIFDGLMEATEMNATSSRLASKLKGFAFGEVCIICGGTIETGAVRKRPALYVLTSQLFRQLSNTFYS